MRHYETMFIVKPTLTPEEIVEKINFYKEAITKNGGEICAVQDMGMRNFAYEINKNKRGYYYVIYFKAASSLVIELERLYRINEDILRFIVIKYEKLKERNAWNTMVEQANKKAEAPKAAEVAKEA
ncbi:MAG: 30S ribosomal protein S6 [Wolinella sp.]